ncbi:hypothetical protein [uncultured Granulicatella sp.]|uniref:hypothetical protein n=1 Tax=uncultured Granulicatella sp. TaxID=316089 RepID=UPI0028DBCF51|nr:hypothetical protein [uncultured Granulicatella sp.]
MNIPFASSDLKHNYTLPKNHIAYFIHLFVSSIPESIIVSESHSILNHDPQLLLKMILFAYHRDTFSGKEIVILNEDNLPMMCLSQQTDISYEEFNAFRKNEYYSDLIKQVFILLNLLLQEHPNLQDEEIPELLKWNHAIENYDKALYEKMSQDYDQIIQKQVDIAIEKEQV